VTDIAIRPLTTTAELAACVALQRDTWGAGFSETVPPSLLRIAQRIGGVALGAFDSGGSLIGFVFGLTGVQGGEIVHWSDMLAVRPEARRLGIGRRLKAEQRTVARAAGATTVLWSFDPLVARNAHINLNRLGATVVEYVPDMYGTTDSALHGGLPTDRFIVSWPLDDAVVARRLAHLATKVDSPGWADAPVLNDMPDPTPAAVRFLPRVRVRVPGDLERVIAAGADAAARWRQATRRSFTAALASGYRVEGIRLGTDGGDACYLLARTP
jgi:chorismate synthase